MPESQNNAMRLLEKLHQALLNLDPAIVGPVRIADEEIVIQDGKLRLSVNFLENEGDTHSSIVHVHVNAYLDRISSKPLAGCFVGVPDRGYDPLDQIVYKWVTTAVPPIFSLMNGQAVLNAWHFSGHEPFAVSRRHGYISPLTMTTFAPNGQKNYVSKSLDANERQFLDAIQNEPLFLNATELVGDDELHFAKVTLENLKGTWVRSLEIDDHQCNIHGEPWPPKYSDSLQAAFADAPRHVMVTGYALFFKAKNDTPKSEQDEIDEAIERTVALVSQNELPELSEDAFLAAGIDPKYVHDLDSFLQLAFGRYILSQLSVGVSETYSLIKKDGSYERSIPLKTVPVFQRAMLLTPGFVNSPKYNEGFKALALSGAEVNAVNNALHNKSKPEDLQMAQPIVCEPGIEEHVWQTSFNEVMSINMEKLKTQSQVKKPWWKFW